MDDPIKYVGATYSVDNPHAHFIFIVIIKISISITAFYE